MAASHVCPCEPYRVLVAYTAAWVAAKDARDRAHRRWQSAKPRTSERRRARGALVFRSREARDLAQSVAVAVRRCLQLGCLDWDAQLLPSGVLHAFDSLVFDPQPPAPAGGRK